MTDNGYLSLDKAHLAKMQRERRASIRRIDYTPSRDALAAFEARQTQERPGSIAATNSAVLDAIVTEWAELTGIKKQEVEAPKTPKGPPEFMHQYARTRMSPAAVRFGPGPVEDSGNAKGWPLVTVPRARKTSTGKPELMDTSQARAWARMSPGIRQDRGTV